MYIPALIVFYLAVGYLFHLFIYPEEKPSVANYFKPGQEFYSKSEGFRQKVIKQENGFVYCSLEVEPFADGPPIHIHNDFDEYFEISNGEISLWINGEVKRIKPGVKLVIPKGTPHKPFNETADTIQLKGQMAFPEKFAFNLVQVYGYMDQHPDFKQSPKTLLQVVLLNAAGFDSYKGDGPPVILQKTAGFFLVPAARFLGFKSYYPEYDIANQGRAVAETKD